MKTDTYTKSILTIIAIALSIIAIKDIDIIPKLMLMIVLYYLIMD